MHKFIKNAAVVSTTASMLFAAVPALAVPNLQLMELSTSGTTRTLVLPEAAGNSPVIVSLGTAVDPVSGKVVEGLAYIHYKKGYGHKDGHNPGNGGGKGNGKGGDGAGETSSCFSYLAKGAAWKVNEPWVLDPSNGEGLTDSYLLSALTDGIAQWEDAADGVIDSVEGADVLGDGSLSAVPLVADESSPDGVNEILFGEISSSGAIAVTIVWGIFSGPPFARELVEWDMVFDEVDYDWSSIGEAGEMDFENIAVHELGHAMGMGHPDSSCTEETMYAFADFGETKKRTLEAGDIAGIDGLY